MWFFLFSLFPIADDNGNSDNNRFNSNVIDDNGDSNDSDGIGNGDNDDDGDSDSGDDKLAMVMMIIV